MKKQLFWTLCVILTVSISSISMTPAPRTTGLAWIWSNYEEYRDCPGQEYAANDLEPGDTVTWYRWPNSNPSIPLEYLGSSVNLYYDFGDYDMVILVVNEGLENEYRVEEWVKPCWW